MPAPKPARDRAPALVKEIRAYCAANADPKLVQKYARYFKEGYDAWGLLDKNHPFFSEKQEEWFDKYRDLGLRGFLRAGALLFESGKYEEGAIAIRFLTYFLDHPDAADTLEGLDDWWAGVRNWAHTDVLCSLVLSPLLQSGRVPLEAFAPWRASGHKFQRRSVPVSMLVLLKKPDADIGALLEFVRPLMLDPERVVHQGVGWFLREAWKKQPKAVEPFLLEWKDTAPRLIFQYATEKMAPAQKARYRAEKAKR